MVAEVKLHVDHLWMFGGLRKVQTIQMVLYIHKGRDATTFAILAGCALADLGVWEATPDERCACWAAAEQCSIHRWCCVLQWCHP